jgi:hypothetical protein
MKKYNQFLGVAVASSLNSTAGLRTWELVALFVMICRVLAFLVNI